ncbi:hypothetical protein DBR43_30235 [Pedobacter sp. KBW06]|nr:hypothetical protein DBR43_30235 [Pedobacter sp. KBW06]
MNNSGYSQVHHLGSTDQTAGWYKLGTLNLPQQGVDVELKIIAGGGYNASAAQNGECVIHFRTSNAFSHNNGFYGSGSYYNTGRTKIASSLRVVQRDMDVWDFYAVLPAYTGGGALVLSNAVTGSWTPGLLLAEPPANIIFSDLTEELFHRSNAYFSENVGIGMDAIDTRGYKLAVNGKIRAHEIRVETANWPDYVFKKEYNLRSLAETEKYILDNGHLPEIPSASEIDKDGLALGEMNKKLLKKIEELTLHLIAMEKLNQLQNVERDKMEQRLRRLENK